MLPGIPDADSPLQPVQADTVDTQDTQDTQVPQGTEDKAVNEYPTVPPVPLVPVEILDTLIPDSILVPDSISVLTVPESIRKKKMVTPYRPELVRSILLDIRGSTVSVRNICEAHNICEDTWYDWLGRSETLAEAHTRAMETRAIHEVDSLTAELEEIRKYLRTVDTKSIGDMKLADHMLHLVDRVQRATEFRAERYNPRVFGRKQEVTLQAGKSPAEARAEAWHRRKHAINMSKGVHETPSTERDTQSNQ